MSIRKIILIFNGHYIPSKNYGGPQTSIENVVNACSGEYDFYIVCKNHDFGSSVPFDVPIDTWCKVGKANVMYVKDGEIDFSFRRISFLYGSLKPDLIWFSGVLVPRNKIVGTLVARKMGIPVLFSPRGELSANRVRIKAYKKIPYLFLLKLLGIYRNCYYHTTSKDETDGVYRFFKTDDGFIFNVPNISIMKQPNVVDYHKQKGRLKLYFMSRIHPVKNLLYALECLAYCKQNIDYDIFGPIEDEDYWKQCQNICSSYKSNINVNYKGYLSRDMMAPTIQYYDALLFTTLNENYGHVIAESLANARPVVISKGTTPWDDVDGKAGFTVSLENPKEVAAKLDYLASLGDSEYNRLIVSTSVFFDNSPLVNAAIEGHKRMFDTIINSVKNKR